MRRMTFATLAAALVVAGCGSSGGADKDGDGKITDAEAAAETAANLPDPGLYKISVEIQELAFPGLPAGTVDEMKKQMSASMQSEECLTEADREEAVKQMTEIGNEECEYSKYDLSGGKIDAAMSCKMDGGGTMTYTMKGTLGSTGVDMVMEGDQQGSDPAATMHMKMRMKSQRIGECRT